MKRAIAFAFIVFIVSMRLLAFECRVTCPRGYRGACAQSAEGCSCSCRASAKEVQADVKDFLKGWGASEKAQSEAGKAVEMHMKTGRPVEPIRDAKTGKEFTLVFAQARND